MMEVLGSGISKEMVINDGRPLAEYLQIDSDQVDDEDIGDIDVSRGIPRRVVVSWSNFLSVKLILFRSKFVFLYMSLPNLIIMWYCGEVQNNIPPYKILRSCDVVHLKHGKSKLSNMKKY